MWRGGGTPLNVTEIRHTDETLPDGSCEVVRGSNSRADGFSVVDVAADVAIDVTDVVGAVAVDVAGDVTFDVAGGVTAGVSGNVCSSSGTMTAIPWMGRSTSRWYFSLGFL